MRGRRDHLSSGRRYIRRCHIGGEAFDDGFIRGSLPISEWRKIGGQFRVYELSDSLRADQIAQRMGAKIA